MKHFATTLKSQRSGSMLIMSVIFLMAVTAIVLSLYQRSTQQVGVSSRRINDPVTASIAESGIEKAVYCLNTPTASSSDCPKNGQGLYVGESNVAVGRGSFTSTVSVSGATATVTVTALTAGLGGGSAKQVVVTLNQTASISPAFQYGVQTGEGGIDMSNNAKVNGNVYTNGSITGQNGSSVTGDAVLAVSSPTTDSQADPAVSPLYTKNIGDAANTVYLAQQFIAQSNDSVYSLDLKLAKHGVGPPGLTAYVYSDNAGVPGTDLSSGGQALTAAFPYDSPAGWETNWSNQIFTPNVILLQNTTYWLVIKAASSNSSKYWTTVRGSDDTSYANGTTKVGAALNSLSALNYDIAFRLNVGGQYPTLDVPVVGGNAYSHTISDTTVTGHAYYQALNGAVTANGGAVTCTLTPNSYCHPGSADQPPQNFPISDAEFGQMEEIAVTGGTTTCSPTCTLNNGDIIGPQKYVGDVTFANNAVVTLNGTVWVSGNLTISNNAILQLAAGYGDNGGVVIIDNQADRANSCLVSLNNNGDLRASANASCTGTPKRCSDGLNIGNTCAASTDCPMNSIMLISRNADPALSTPAIDVANNLTAGVLYAPNGLVSILNNASLKEVTAQKISLANNAQIKYLTGLASAIFSSGPGGAWQLKPGSYHIAQ